MGADVRSRVDRIMVEEFEVERDRLHPDALLQDGLGLDSLDAVDLIVALEKEFSFRIAETEARGIRSLGDVYTRISERLEGTAGGAQ